LSHDENLLVEREKERERERQREREIFGLHIFGV
jgi:hypothetical protein